MKINVGTKNPSKIEAVKEILKEYPDLKGAEVVGVECDSNVPEQPKTIDDTIKGAINRAKNCFKNCKYSIGLESGIRKVPYTKSGYMDVTACAIFDGKEFHIGLSSSFEYPKKVIRIVLDEGINISSAFNKAGLTKDDYIGFSEGAVGMLTKGRLNRKEYTKQALRTALIHLENKELY